MAIIPGRLKRAREEAGLSQEDVAKKLRITSSGYGFFEQGKRQPSINYLMRLGEVLNKPITFFLEVEDTNGNLSEDEKRLLETYRKLSYSTKQDVLTIVQALAQKENEH